MIGRASFPRKNRLKISGFFLPKPEADILMPLVAAHLDALFGAAARRIVDLACSFCIVDGFVVSWGMQVGCKWFAFGD